MINIDKQIEEAKLYTVDNTELIQHAVNHEPFLNPSVLLVFSGVVNTYYLLYMSYVTCDTEHGRDHHGQ